MVGRDCNFLFTFACFAFVPCCFYMLEERLCLVNVSANQALNHGSLILYYGLSMQLHFHVAETREIPMSHIDHQRVLNG